MSNVRFLTAGESHGPSQVAILEGIPAGLAISHENINSDLKKRMWDFGRGGRGKIETDQAKILSGVRHGKTLGSPIALLVENADFINWDEKMSIEDMPKGTRQGSKVTTPRPGHADLTGILKYGFDDVRDVLERASARETVMRVAIGGICRKFLLEFCIEIASHTIQIGSAKLGKIGYTFADVKTSFAKDPDCHCIDTKAREAMKQEITKARLTKNTLGGVLEVIAHNVPVGLGSYVHYDRRLDGKIAQALMSIPSVKAVEIGKGIEITVKMGSEIHDEILLQDGKLKRKTNNMGGIEGGMSNGEDIVVCVYHKPLSTLYNPLATIDIATKKASRAVVERSDVCVVPRAGVVSEAMLAFVLTQALLEKFGGDSIKETKRNYKNYKRSLPFT